VACADDSVKGPSSNGQNLQGQNQYYNGQQNGQYQNGQNGQGNNGQFGNGGDFEEEYPDPVEDSNYPSFLLRGKGSMAHREGNVIVHQKLTFKIDGAKQETRLDVMFAVSGDHTKQVNESIIGNGNGSNVIITNTRSSKDDVKEARETGNFKDFRAFIYANQLKKENTLKNKTYTWNAATPLPAQIRPGNKEIYSLLKDAGSYTYVTKITGHASFDLHTTVSILSLDDNEAVIKMTNSIPSDPSGRQLDLMPVADEQIATVDVKKREIKEIKAKSYYVDSSNGRKYLQDMTYEICAFKKDGELTVYTLCNY